MLSSLAIGKLKIKMEYDTKHIQYFQQKISILKIRFSKIWVKGHPYAQLVGMWMVSNVQEICVVSIIPKNNIFGRAS